MSEDRCVVFDCRFNLLATGVGRQAWQAGHIPGARYAHLDEDLAGPVTTTSGRHPLPAANDFAAFLARSGWRPGRHVVAYDAAGGQIAARLWWLMRYFGHDEAALLDGGLAAWTGAGLPLEEGSPAFEACAPVELVPRDGMVVAAGELLPALALGKITLLDARSGERFRGEAEPLDSVAGHVPGARNAPCDANLRDGRLKPAAELKSMYAPFASESGGRTVVHMCGSGVTACFNLFAMERAGFHDSRLYAGSWSEWIRDPERPVAVGQETETHAGAMPRTS